MKSQLISTATLSFALLLSPPSSADASAYCGQFVVPPEHDGANVIIVGESTMPPIFGGDIAFGEQRAAICYMDASGGWHFKTLPGCSFFSPPDERLRIEAGDGDDIVLPLVRQDPRLDFVCPSTPRERMFPFHNYPSDLLGGEGCTDPDGCSLFPFGLDVVGGPGVDVIHGSPNDDRLTGALLEPVCFEWGGQQFCGELMARGPDLASDTLCGYNGADELIGDNSPGRAFAECIDGGAGEDECHGLDEDYDWSPVGSCEVLTGAREIASYYVAPPAGMCCYEDPAPGCAAAFEDRSVQNCVCDAMPSCCTDAWTEECVVLVDDLGCGTCEDAMIHPEACGTCGEPVSGCSLTETFNAPPLLSVLVQHTTDDLELFFAPQARTWDQCLPN